MTSTPESWDDVGCLRLQVDCVSQKVEDVQTGLAVVQKLKDEVARLQMQEREQRKERYQMKICSIIAAFLFSCVLAVQIFMIYQVWAPRSTQAFPDEASRMHLEYVKTSEPTPLVPASQANSDTQRKGHQWTQKKPVYGAMAKGQSEKEMAAEQHLEESENMDEDTGKIMSTRRGHGDGALKVATTKPSIISKALKNKKPKPTQALVDEIRSTQHTHSATDIEGHVQTVAKNHAEGFQYTVDHAKDATWQAFIEEKGDENDEQRMDESWETKETAEQKHVVSEDETTQEIISSQEYQVEVQKASQDKAVSLADHMKALCSKVDWEEFPSACARVEALEREEKTAQILQTLHQVLIHLFIVSGLAFVMLSLRRHFECR